MHELLTRLQCSPILKSQSSDDLMLVIKGSPFADSLYASNSTKSKVLGLEGDDSIWSGTYDYQHIINGGPGNDFLSSSKATTKIIGGSGDDELSCFSGLPHDALISGGSGNDYIQLDFAYPTVGTMKGWRLLSGSGDDEIIYNGVYDMNSSLKSKIDAGDGNDIIGAAIGYNDKTKIYCGSGNDIVRLPGIPKAPKTFIDGGSGTDTLILPSSPSISGNSSNAILTYQAFTANGIGYQQKIYLSGIEVLSINGQEQLL